MGDVVNYYNENDPKIAAWLKELIKARLIPEGEVDERSIEDVSPSDVKGFKQCHFFAGIGGWSYALRLAGWPDDRPVWTGSCPCQPYSSAGKRKGNADERNLWPALFHLIENARPTIVFGEQVASKDGRTWLSGVHSDLEALGYSFGAADLCAAGVKAPHIRQRLYWMADSRYQQEGRASRSREKKSGRAFGDITGFSSSSGLVDPNGERTRGDLGTAPGPEKKSQCERFENGPNCELTVPSSEDDRVGNAAGKGLEGQWREHITGGEGDLRLIGFAMQDGIPEWNGPTIAVRCQDGARRASVESSLFPLAYGISHRMVKLRGSGNAIVPQVAQAFIEITMYFSYCWENK